MQSAAPQLQFKGLEARPGNLKAIFEKNMMLARNKITHNIIGDAGLQVVRSAIPSFEENSLRQSLAPPEPPRKTAEEIEEEQRIIREAEEARLEAQRVIREAEERRKAVEAEKERLRLAEIARKEAEVKAHWDAAYNKVKIDLGVVNMKTRWSAIAEEKFEAVRTEMGHTTGFLPPRLSDSQMMNSPLVEHFTEALSPRNKQVEEPVEEDRVPTVDVTEEAVEAEEEERVPTAEAEEAPVQEAEPVVVEAQYTQAEPVETTEEVVVSPVSVTTQERSSPLHVKATAEKEKAELPKESAPTTATTSLDVEAEEIEAVIVADPAADIKEESTDASSKDVEEVTGVETKTATAAKKNRKRSNANRQKKHR